MLFSQIKLTLGAGGFALFGASYSALTPPNTLLPLFLFASLAPYAIAIVTESTVNSHKGIPTWVGPVRYAAAVWFLVAFAVAVALTLHRGASLPSIVFLAASLIGVLPCIVWLVRRS
jgi:hypothetical protein